MAMYDTIVNDNITDPTNRDGRVISVTVALHMMQVLFWIYHS